MASILQHLRHHLNTRCLLCTLALLDRSHTPDPHLIAGLASLYKKTSGGDEGVLCRVCVEVVMHKEVRWRCQRCKVAHLGDVIPEKLSCELCQTRPLALAQLAVALDYTAPVDSLIWRFKSLLQLRMAPQLAHLMAGAIQAELWQLPKDTWVVAIPSRRQAVLQRGFNPAAELARYLAKFLGLRWQSSALALAQPEALYAQKHRSQDQRWQYAQRAFQWRSKTTPTTLLVVDDVLTTGSTLHGAALCAQAQGVQQVYGVALARTPWLSD